MAKRLNTPFVAVLAAVCFVGFCAVIALPALKSRFFTRPIEEVVKEQRKLAQKLREQGRYPEAQEAIDKAWGMDKKNKEVCLERGDIYMLLTDEEGNDALDHARIAWENALAIDPHFKPALDRLMTSYIDQIELAPSAQACERLGGTAARILKFDPADSRALAYQQIAIIQQWVLGNDSFTSAEIDNTLARLGTQLAHDPKDSDPSHAEILFYIARGNVFAAAKAYETSHWDVAEHYLAETRALLDSQTAAFPDHPVLNFRAFQGYVALADTEQFGMLSETPKVDTVRPATAPATGPSIAPATAPSQHHKNDIRAQVEKDKATADLVLRRARENVKETDERYADLQYVAAEWARRNGHADEAEKILLAFYEKNKTDQSARLAYCRILALTGDPAKRDEAIQILELPVRRTGQPGLRKMTLLELESQTKLDLTSLRVAKYPTEDPSKHAALMAQIEEGYRAIEKIAAADAIPVLRLKGLIAQLQGQNVVAVQSLTRALYLLKNTDQSNPIKWDLMYQLATVERLAGQNHSAQLLLKELVDRFETYNPARLQLTETYLEENRLDEVREQIAVLDKRLPNSQEVLRLKVSEARRRRERGGDKADDAKLQALYTQLVEGTFAEKVIKAQVAATLPNYDETIRLLMAMQQMKPNETAITAAIYQAYQRKKDTKGADEVLSNALRKFPNDPRLLQLKREKDHPSPIQPDRILGEFLAIEGDPLSVEIRAGFLALSNQNYTEALAHARAADGIRPDDPRTWDLYFQIYKEQQNWDLGMQAAAKLTTLDADQAGGRMYSWTLSMSRGDYSKAIYIARELTIYRPNFGQSWILLGEALQANGEFEEAIKQYENALARQTTNIRAYKGMAICYENINKPERAREWVEQGQRQFPDDPSMREWLWSYLSRTDPLALVPKREKLLSETEDTENYLNLAAACNRAAEWIFSQDPARAHAYNTQALDVLTRGVGKFPEDIRLNRELAIWLRSAGRFDDGVKVLQALNETPAWKGKPDALMLLAEYYARSGKYPEAEKAYRDAWATTHNLNIEIELRLANFFHVQHKYDQALKLLEANASNPSVIVQVLKIHIAANHTEQAMKGLDDALAKDPKNPELLDLKAGVLIDALDYVRARTILAEVLSIDPRNEVAMFFQAMTELRDPIASDIDMALNDLRTIVGRNPRNIQYHLLYVEALMRINDLALAAQELEGAVRMDPFNREIRMRLLDIYVRLKNWPDFEKAVQFAEQNPTISEAIWFRMHAYKFVAQTQHERAIARSGRKGNTDDINANSNEDGHFPEAIERIRTAISMSPQNAAFWRDYMIILMASEKQENYKAVLAESDRLFNLNHQEWWVHHMRALACIALARTADAEEQINKALAAAEAENNPEAWQQVLETVADMNVDKALALVAARIARDDPSKTRWRLQSVSLHIRKQDWAGAISDLETLLPGRNKLRRDERLSAIRFAAECYQASGNFKVAEVYYLEWLKEAPNDPSALNNYACLLAEDKARLEDARTFSQKAYETARKHNIFDPAISDTQGWILSRLGGNYGDNGVALLKDLVIAQPEMIDARYHLGMAYLMRAVDPEFAKLREGLKGEIIAQFKTDALAQLTAASELIKKNEQSAKKVPVRHQLKDNVEVALKRATKAVGSPTPPPGGPK